MHRFFVLLAVIGLLVGCGGSSETGDQTAAQKAASKTAVHGDPKGVGPIKEVTLGPIDAAVAAHGKEIFETKCSACHKIEERYVGPPLAGVTKRREPEWILNMILNPDKMIKEDPQAKELFTTYLTPMTFQNVTEEDAMAILTYFRSIDEGAGSGNSSP